MRIKIDFEIQFKTPFHSGTGLPSGLINRGVQRDYNGLLYIPATTYKGILREKVEGLISCCYPGQKKELLAPNDSYNNMFMNYYNQKPGIIESLFGTNINQGEYHFSNLKMNEEDNLSYRRG